jgi:hypothetical protein
MKKIIYVFTLALLFAGCSKMEPVQNVDWYKEHANELKAMLEKCKNNPAELSENKNCINAAEAKSSLVWGSNKFNNPPVLEFK